MVIGLAILGIVAILIFFGVTERFFRRMGLSNPLAFLIVLLLVIGAVVPPITIGAGFSMNVSGFLIPIALITLFCALLGANSDLLRAFVASVAVAGIAVAARMLIMPVNFASLTTAAVIVGFVGGSVAYLIAVTRLATAIAAVTGIVAGDIIVNVLYRFVLGADSVALGGAGVFDSIIIAAVLGVALVELVSAMRRTVNRRRVGRNALNAESAEDNDFANREISTLNTDDDFADYFKPDPDSDSAGAKKK
ncbi:MAG: hypothetical protein LBP26_04775 [Clostridiales bacterium]|jgi:hypothetical protein|nr:hypothetical protein [Clostridiales bacterium]